MQNDRTKIGIVTWWGTPNYGTTLQAYALYRKVKDLGYDPYLIRRFTQPFTPRNIKDNLNRLLGIRRFWKYSPEPFPGKLHKIKQFCRKHLKERHVVGPCGLRRLLSDTCIFVAGSDQIWNCRDHFRGFEFLDFAPGRRKISYASSIGGPDIPQEYHGRVAAYLKEFESLSLREESGASAVASLGFPARTVLDPTFLLSAAEWEQISAPAAKEPYILVYLLRKDESYHSIIRQIQQESGIKEIRIVPSGENPGLNVPGARVESSAGIEEFVALLSGAALVCTDSFHGMAMSINLSRQFVAFLRFNQGDSNSQNSRVEELLGRFGLKERLWKGSLPAPTDYTSVKQKLEALRQESLSFLDQALKGRKRALPPTLEYFPVKAENCYAAGLPSPLPSSSGGIAFALSRQFITSGGRVWATRFNASCQAEVAEVHDLQELESFRGSKYVQSRLDKACCESIKAALGSTKVLFIGTPCQVAALRSSLKDTDTSGLVCADLLCHGTTPESYLQDELAYLGRRHSLGRPLALSFRQGARFRLKVEGSSGKVYERRAERQPYFLGYLGSTTLRDSCYNCPFAGEMRTGDITIGDFITEKGPSEGKSFVSLNSSKGRKVFGLIAPELEIRGPEGILSARESYRPAILEASVKTPEHYRFKELLPRLGFAKAIRRALRARLMRNHPLYKKAHHLAHQIKSALIP
ncbi:MAG: polysaccharide pyruvyl transferase family protein [Bacteroidales bacterium]|nr:polysaccharide pyruvyl transferase family protein [Bacteroidales bacterium]